jgi:hypothetical protein
LDGIFLPIDPMQLTAEWLLVEMALLLIDSDQNLFDKMQR